MITNDPPSRPGIFEVPFGAAAPFAMPPPKRRRGGRPRTTPSQRTTIRIAYLFGRTLEDLAAQYKVSHVTIANIVNGVGPRYAAEVAAQGEARLATC